MIIERVRYPSLCRLIASWNGDSVVAESYSVDDPSHLDLAEAAAAPYAT